MHQKSCHMSACQLFIQKISWEEGTLFTLCIIKTTYLGDFRFFGETVMNHQ